MEEGPGRGLTRYPARCTSFRQQTEVGTGLQRPQQGGDLFRQCVLVQQVETQPVDIDVPVNSFQQTACCTDVFYDKMLQLFDGGEDDTRQYRHGIRVAQ